MRQAVLIKSVRTKLTNYTMDVYPYSYCEQGCVANYSFHATMQFDC